MSDQLLTQPTALPLSGVDPLAASRPVGAVGPLQKGVALLARRAKVPIIPAVIVGSFQAWPLHRLRFRPWPIRVRYGPAMMDLAGLTADEILATVDRTLRTMFEELRQHDDAR